MTYRFLQLCTNIPSVSCNILAQIRGGWDVDLVLLDSHEPLSAAVVEKIFTGCRDILSFTFLEIFDRVVGTFLTGSVFLLVIGDFATSLHW